MNLDSSASLDLHMSPAQRKQRSEESLEALAKAMKVASSNSVDAVLVPGNLFDADNVTTTTLSRVQKIFALLGEIPVFITPGTNDPHFTDSPYDSSALRAHGLEPWSENVHIFSGRKMQSVALPNKGSVKVSGIGMSREGRRQTPQASQLPEMGKMAVEVLLLPLGSADTENEKPSDSLFSEIKSKGYSYTALSGFKNSVTLKSGDKIFAAAAGTFIGQTEAEAGRRYALFGNLDRRMSGGLELSLQLQEFDPRRIVPLNLNVTGKDPAWIQTLLDTAMKKKAVRQGSDIVVLHLQGFFPSGTQLNLDTKELKENYFHVKVINNTRPDYLETLAEKNIIEANLASIMDELKRKSEEENNDNKDERISVIEDALYYGLEAIREGKVTIRNAD